VKDTKAKPFDILLKSRCNQAIISYKFLLTHLRNKGFNGTVTYPSSDLCGIDTSQTNPAELNISMISFSVICK